MTQNQIDGGRQIRDRSITAIKLAIGVIDEFARDEAVYTTTTLSEFDQETGTLTLGSGFRLLIIEANVPARVRLYTTLAKQTADAGRLAGTDPSGDHGVILDYVTTATCLSADLSPVVDGYSTETVLSDDCPITVDMLDPTPATVVVTITYIVLEN